MSLLHFDSFNYYPSTDYLSYLYTQGATPATLSLDGRDSTYCLNIGTNESIFYSFTANTDITVGFAINIADVTSIAKLICSFRDSALGVQVQAYKQANTGVIELYLNNTWKAESTLALESSTWYFIEFSVHIANSGGTFTCYVDGEEWTSYTGDTQYRTSNTVNQIGLAYSGCFIDDLYVASGLTMLGDCSIAKTLPISNGSVIEWDASAGSNYQTIDEDTQDGDTSYNSTSTNSEKDSFDFQDTPSNINIYGIRVLLFARKDDVDAHVIRPFVIIGGITYYGDNISVADAYDYYEYIWENSPSSSSAWTEAEVNSAQFGYERVS